MIYREHFHYPEKLAHLIETHNSNISMIIRGLAREILDDSGGDMYELYDYFSKVYDIIYNSILFQQLHLDKETRELLEMLAIPLFQRDKKEQNNFIEKYLG